LAPRQAKVLKGHGDIGLLPHSGQDAKGNPITHQETGQRPYNAENGGHKGLMYPWFHTANVLLHALGKGDSISENRCGLLKPHDVTTKAVQTCDGSTIMQPA
jgi:hypothetical protein